ncbi:hypothetical protein GCM10025879_12260 [Leuconostoc litchii]|uniref:Uncharacterized protein n=1 Tax=Leuconostoc litchii TaxID=1981069 RepID=A0A6P2CK78_9LACO|nr:hypothetical protein [Leuconostoc litchii]TYC46268.1 hypothetical protein ESZ47_07270 [Leuconostoc litchii]GMA69980.1 hypothetical protein GCM10025879_12260 [Leuconostoc litchii]
MIKSKNEWLQQYITVIYESKEPVFRIVDTDALYTFTGTKFDDLLDSKKIKLALLDSFRSKGISLGTVSDQVLRKDYGLELISKS